MIDASQTNTPPEKVFGANIFCSICRAQPFPDDPEIRETFDLLKIDGVWLCELHRQPEDKVGTSDEAGS